MNPMADVDWNSLPPTEMLNALESARVPLTLELVDALVLRKSEVIAPMLALVKDPSRWVDAGQVWTPLALLHLLGMMGDPSAAPALIELATTQDLGDWTTESLASVLACLGPSTIPALEAAAKVEETNPYVRHAFFRAIYMMAVAAPALRPECVRVARTLFESPDEDFQDLMTSDLILIDDPELKRSLEEWFKAQGPGFRMVSPEHLARSWAKRDFWRVRHQRAPREYFEGALHRASKHEPAPAVETKPAAREQKKGDTPKNQPCPCGSGLKFKRCHGA